MKAAQIAEYGDVDVLKVQDALPPSPSQGQVLIEVHAASVNPVDSFIHMGYMKEYVQLQLPATIGGDVAGVVTAVGSGVSAFRPGDRVYGQAANGSGGSGAFAELAVAPAGSLAKIPAALDFRHAAALPLTGVSAIQALYEALQLKTGQRILITGAAGGIGTVAVQAAKALGAYVAAAAREKHREYVESLGADQFINTDETRIGAVIKDFDAVFDTAGGDSYKSSFAALRPGGTILTIAGQPDQELAKKHGVTALGQMTQVTSQRLDRLSELVAEGTIRPVIDKVFSLDSVKEAFRARAAGGTHGKIVLGIR